MSRTRIVATIGPATCSEAALGELADAGMDVARLNGSHADLDWHAAAIDLLRRTLPGMPILFDIPGRKIRTGDLLVEPVFEQGDVVTLTTDPTALGGDRVPVSYPLLHEDVSPGVQILADDGTLSFVVEEVRGRDILCRAGNAGQLKSRKGINVPSVVLRSRMVTGRDENMIGFARDQGIDFIGISFVESAAHVLAVRALTGDRAPRIVAKIENQGGLENLEEIVRSTDVIMIDRGDLSVETSLESLALFQKRILEAARQAATPVIVATEMLHTMIDNPYPTKAEVSDITNAVLDGCSATMLSGETAIGAFPARAVSTMREIANVAADHLQDRLDEGVVDNDVTVPVAMSRAIALICRTLPVTRIVAITISGYAARAVAASRPRQPVLAVSNDPSAARSFNLLPGTEGVCLDIPFSRTSTDHIVVCLEALWRQDRLGDDDLVLVTAVGYPRSGNRMNLIQTHYMRDLADALGWRRPVAVGANR